MQDHPRMDAAAGSRLTTSVRKRPIPSVLKALDDVLLPDYFPCASNYHLFKDAQFGRDALEVAEDLLEIQPRIARSVITCLARLQGTIDDARLEEEPGKIHHEYRSPLMGGRPIAEESRVIFHNLARSWQVVTSEEELAALTELTYYGTVDATPLYVRLVARYCALFGPEILDVEYTPRRGVTQKHRLTIRDSVRCAVEWIVRTVEKSDLGLLEWHRMNPRGHRFQAWKDGGNSYLHRSGRLANGDAPMASIEVQGLAYDALRSASTLVGNREEEARWNTLADRLQRATLELFWIPDERYFAMAIDRNPESGEPGQVRLISSNAGATLDSGLFENLQPEARREMVSSIVDRIYSEEFLTPVGIRCNSLVHSDIPGYAAYQSSYTVWHKETYDIAKGFRRHGFSGLADDLENRLLNGVNVSGSPTEFLYVLPDNRVVYDPLNLAGLENVEEIVGTNIPENDQAWSISAALAIKWRHGHSRARALQASGWQEDLEERKRSRFPPVRLFRTVSEVESAFPTSYAVRVAIPRGLDLEKAFMAQQGA